MQGPTPFPTDAIAGLRGVVQVVNVPNPASAADWTYTIPGGYYGRLRMGYEQYVTSATVGNRFPGFTITDGNVTVWLSGITNATAASTSDRIGYGPGSSLATGSGGNVPLNVPTPFMWLPSSWTFGSATSNIQVGDQYSLINMVWEFIERQTVDQYLKDIELDLRVS